MNCRFCKTKLEHVFVDLVNAPASNSYLTKDQLNEPEIFYPLKIYVCQKCKLVQIDEYKKSDDIFDKEYAYFSSISTSWVEHAKNYVEMITEKLHLTCNSQVIEIASNDGYLLQFFKEKNISCLGIEPTKSTANVARSKGIEVIEDFFGEELAFTLPKADLILGNNVLAHVPDINDFVMGLKKALKSDGVITMEFPHLLNLIEQNQFDTIYHEHFSYLSLLTTITIFKFHGLNIYDVEELPTHGGSLRIFATHSESDKKATDNVAFVLEKERIANMHLLEGYKGFQLKANSIKYEFLGFLLKVKSEQKKVIAYGAAAKGNTLLNYCGIKNDLIDFVVDRAPLKTGRFLPGSHIPIVSEEEITRLKPDYIVIFPWNIKEEVMKQLNYVREWGCEFIVVVPRLEIL